MVIYAEYLFLENFLTGMMILILTGKISGISLKKSLLIIGSTLCGAYSFLLFWDTLAPWLALLLKLVFSVLVTLLVFQTRKIRQLLRVILIFYLVSFLMGGITIGAMYFFGFSGVTQNAAVYMDHITYFHVASGCALTYMGLSLFSDFIKGRLNREKTNVNVQIELESKIARMKGMVDTGNFLRDPLTGKPVLIITVAGAGKLLPPEIIEELKKEEKVSVIYENLMKSGYANRIRMIPYRSIGAERGYMIGIRADKIQIETQSGTSGDSTFYAPEGTILAIHKGMIAEKYSEDGCSILLHPNIIEGGVACNV